MSVKYFLFDCQMAGFSKRIGAIAHPHRSGEHSPIVIASFDFDANFLCYIYLSQELNNVYRILSARSVINNKLIIKLFNLLVYVQRTSK